MFGVSHGALQFMTYEEMKNAYNEYRKLPIDTKLVSKFRRKQIYHLKFLSRLTSSQLAIFILTIIKFIFVVKRKCYD